MEFIKANFKKPINDNNRLIDELNTFCNDQCKSLCECLCNIVEANKDLILQKLNEKKMQINEKCIMFINPVELELSVDQFKMLHTDLLAEIENYNKKVNAVVKCFNECCGGNTELKLIDYRCDNQKIYLRYEYNKE